MDRELAIRKIKETFESPFDRGRFIDFIRSLFNHIEIENKHPYSGNFIPDAFRGYISTLQRIAKYEDSDENKIDILIVHLKKKTSLEKARSTQRNFISWYLNGSRGGILKDAALVAFVSPGLEDWRFSLVRMDYEIDVSKKKVRVKQEFTPARRFSFLVGENEKSHTAQSRLIPILQNDTSNPTLKDLEEAFSIEKVTKEFFEKYRNLFVSVKDSLDKIVQENNKIKEDFKKKDIKTVDFSKKLLGQIVFLYFLQKKGWFGVAKNKEWGSGSKNFLRELFAKKHCSYSNFFNDVLEPLFYEALRYDRSHDNNYYSKFGCRIPFLNGGLFDPINDYNWADTDISIPDELFSNENPTKEGDKGDGILDIFDRYNFTVKEDEPLEKEVAVDPEMLGKVFENLLEIKDRKSKGTYYTPREIVHYMCQQSLINYLYAEINPERNINIKEDPEQGKLIGKPDPKQLKLSSSKSQKAIISKEDIEKLIQYGESIIEHDNQVIKKGKEAGRYSFKLPKSIRDNAKLIDEKLTSIRVCDPAIGSGAFIVGMMSEIIRARNVLISYIKNKKNRTIYDFKRHAIQNCLYGVDIDLGAVEIAKLRLWLSLIVDEEDIKQIKPLPNLDYKIVCGNSLLGYPYTPQGLDKIEQLKDKLFGITDPNKKQKLREKIDGEINKLLSNTKRSLGYKVDFDFKIHFSEVFREKDGFNVMIANPPYVKEYVNKSAFDGLRNSPYYQGKMDLWYMFACRGIDLVRDNVGVMTFIAQNNWVTSHGALKMRNKVIQDTQILSLIDFGNFKVFKTAGIQTMVMIFRKNSSKNEYNFDYRRIISSKPVLNDVIDILNKAKNVNNEYLNPSISRQKFLGKNLLFSDSEIEVVLNKIYKVGNFYLDAVKEVAQGIVCPQDFVNKTSQKKLNSKYKVGGGIFILKDNELKSLNLSKKELTLIKPFYTTKELRKWSSAFSNKKWVIYTDSSFRDKDRIREYPNIKNHLDKFTKVITSDNKPYGLHRSRDKYFFKGEKIIVARKCLLPTFTYTDFDSYVSATFYVIKTKRVKQKYLTGLLNSKLITFWLKHKGKMQGNNYQIDKEPILELPLIKPKDNNQKRVVDIVDKILVITKDEDYLENPAKQAKVKECEKQIDLLVYELYDLTAEEIKIVEQRQ